MNFLIVDGVRLDESIGADVIELDNPKMPTLRNDSKTIWGRDGYVNGIENAYDDEDYNISILCENPVVRKKVIECLSTAKREISINIKSTKYTRIGKVIEHDMEWISVKSTLHSIRLKLQPFYFVVNEVGECLNSRLNYNNYSDLPAMVKLVLHGDGGSHIGNLIMRGRGIDDLGVVFVTTWGLVVDGLRKEVTYTSFDRAGKSAGKCLFGAREIFSPGASASKQAYRYVKGDNWGFPYIPPVSKGGRGFYINLIREDTKVVDTRLKVVATVYERYLLPYDVFDEMEV